MFFTASNMATGSVNNACLRSLICLYETSIGQFVYQALTPNQNMVHIPDATTPINNGTARPRFTRQRPETLSNINGITSKTNGMYTNLHIANSMLVTASATAPRCDRLPIIPGTANRRTESSQLVSANPQRWKMRQVEAFEGRIAIVQPEYAILAMS